MRSRSEIISRLINPGIVAVVRTDKPGQLPAICEALITGGVIAIEITFTVPNALEAIRDASQRCGDRALIGAGTVLNAEMCRAAIGAGAEFVVSPITRLEIVTAAHSLDKPVMIGAYTPTEAQTAHEAGADFIKIFPADKLGPSYIKSLRAPLPLRTAGVSRRRCSFDPNERGECLRIRGPGPVTCTLPTGRCRCCPSIGRCRW